VSLIWGLDVLAGKGKQEAEIFSYAVDPLHGNDAPRSTEAADLEENEAEDDRRFSGLYGQIDWKIGERVNVLAGARLNYTHEIRRGEEDLPTGPAPARETRSDTKPSGFIGATWKAWSRDNDRIDLFANYRSSFKPAAVDFGPEAEADILKPETADSWEIGIKMLSLDGHVAADLSYFDMTMDNLVVSQSNGGSPALANAGTLYLKGAEFSVEWYATDSTTLHLAYAHHDSKFGDYVQDFDGLPTQLRGNSLELSPDDSGSAGIRWVGKSGIALSADYTYTGERFLNKRNTSLAGSFSVVDASASYRFQSGWEVRLDGRNLTDSRDPVSESELGEGQYYRMPARTFSLSATMEWR
jgi:iron complex outermembrane receptor protein